MSLAIPSAESLSEAWLRALEAAAGSAGGRVVNLVMTVTDPAADEVQLIRGGLDRHLRHLDTQSVDTVAETVFPRSLYTRPCVDWAPDLPQGRADEIDGYAEDLYADYSSMLPLLRTCHSNRLGTYFSRMISWPGREPGGMNQLDLLIQRLRQVRTRGQATVNTLDVDLSADSQDPAMLFGGAQVYAASDRRSRGFPCLVHLDFSLLNGILHCAAVYRHHYLVTKAYGNLLGLSWLMEFICRQTGFKMGELVVLAGLADSKDLPRSKELARRLRDALDHGGGMFGDMS